MENLIFSINVVLPLFLIMCLGTFLRKINIFNDSFLKTANKFAFKVLLPALLFNNIYNSEISKAVNLKLIIFAISIVIITIGALFIIIPKFEKDKRNIGVIIQGLFRSNIVLFGIPLCSNIFGESSVAVTSTLIGIIIPIYNFTAVIVLEMYSKDKLDIKRITINILKNPLIIGSMLGIIATSINLKLPTSIEKTISDLAVMATPLALMVLGGEIEITKIGDNIKYIISVVLTKLIIIPVIIIIISLIFGFRGSDLGILFIFAASPIAVSSYTMAQQYNCNYELAGQLVFVSTIVSAITIFMFVYVLKMINLI
ncbi:AEC family transporter [Sedimentibacter sp. MB31-C6]|uniref:AEC family transporter n=1 Tax=Sedimentibacter sp. MB31-C6 TaxID=3109366 RepID=UPI002DDD95D4|nr:AEC family transporter [Sedimentibacter sp. MB36-C1]WSI05249.1 AEC family transporter [Sedimentibacter sp. MB36-C1]